MVAALMCVVGFSAGIADAGGIAGARSSAPRALATFDAQGIRFKYPSSWTVRSDYYPSDGFFSAIVSVGNQHQTPPCTSTPSTLSCGQTIAALHRDGIYISWSVGISPPATPNVTIGRHPASLTVNPPGVQLPGTDESWAIRFQGADSATWIADISMRGPHLAALRTEANRMLASVQFPG
jgi:hypothetical protein